MLFLGTNPLASLRKNLQEAYLGRIFDVELSLTNKGIEMQVQTQTITTYVANDGTSFNTPDECQMYEKSKLPYYKRIAVEQEFMWYEDNRDELHACGNDYSDLTDAIKEYTSRVISDALEMKDKGSSLDEIMIEFGLILKE